MDFSTNGGVYFWNTVLTYSSFLCAAFLQAMARLSATLRRNFRYRNIELLQMHFQYGFRAKLSLQSLLIRLLKLWNILLCRFNSSFKMFIIALYILKFSFKLIWHKLSSLTVLATQKKIFYVVHVSHHCRAIVQLNFSAFCITHCSLT